MYCHEPMSNHHYWKIHEISRKGRKEGRKEQVSKQALPVEFFFILEDICISDLDHELHY